MDEKVPEDQEAHRSTSIGLSKVARLSAVVLNVDSGTWQVTKHSSTQRIMHRAPSIYRQHDAESSACFGMQVVVMHTTVRREDPPHMSKENDYWRDIAPRRCSVSPSSGRGTRHLTAHPFDPARDIPSLAGKVVLITGAAGDLGRETAIELARYGRPARIYIADLPRDESAKAALIDRVTREAYGDEAEQDSSPRTAIRFLDLDLTSFASVRACATEFISAEDRLDILVLNAGVIRVPPLLTSEGYELHFGLNYLGHALLARLLVPKLQQTAQSSTDVRIVVISSEGHAVAPKEGILYSKVKTTCPELVRPLIFYLSHTYTRSNPMLTWLFSHAKSYAQRYGQSKLALIGLMRELARRYPDIKSAAVHPGRILTGMADSLRKESMLARVTTPISPLFCVSVPVGIRNHLWVATNPDMVSGTYYEPVGIPAKTSKAAEDEAMPKQLWEWTSTELKGLDVLD
ncbi:hypothetical protein NPX13_g786 [Xylaria arbuscula]|uniref:Uncharacterized protein n=1 Tax=Xylaria arbuscula TaxID=114810 RepID=A0A9W8NNN8_9PEZI|nr:hypothetical protein NPX13_g786 [Xylaria arbuscula]